jgi:hypothetical protein
VDWYGWPVWCRRDKGQLEEGAHRQGAGKAKPDGAAGGAHGRDLGRHGIAKTADKSESAPPPLSSLADELTKFTSLHDQGVIGDEEFEAIKKRLVGQVMEQVVDEPPPVQPTEKVPNGLVDKDKALRAQMSETRGADLAALKAAGVRSPQRELKRQNNRKSLELLGLKPGQTKWQKKQAAAATQQQEQVDLPPPQWAPDPTGENDLRY